ncbi:hypothetical protein STEG23_027127, partial [Scotinomys teguina]
MEGRISNVEDTIDKIDSSVKENTKSKKVMTQNVQEIWDTMKRPNLRIEEGEEYQLKGTENTFNKIIEEKFPNLNKDIPIKDMLISSTLELLVKCNYAVQSDLTENSDSSMISETQDGPDVYDATRNINCYNCGCKGFSRQAQTLHHTVLNPMFETISGRYL